MMPSLASNPAKPVARIRANLPGSRLPANGPNELSGRFRRPATRQTYFLTFLGGLLTISVVHLAIGSDVVLIAMLDLIAATGVMFILRPQIYVSNIFIFLLSIYSATAALLAKAALGQPLQSNLQQPTYSLLILLIGFISTASAIHFIPHRRQFRLFQKASVALNSPAFLRTFTPVLFCVGLGTQVLHTILKPQLINGTNVQSAGFGGFGSLYFVLIFSAVLYYKRLAETRSVANYVGVAVVGLSFLALSMAGNVKRDIIDFISISLLSMAFFKIRVRVSSMATIGILLFIVVAYISPAIHLMRNDFQKMTIVERVDRFFEIIAENDYNFMELQDLESRYFESFEFNHSPDGSYIYPSTANLDRFFLILPLDQVTRYYNTLGSMGVGTTLQWALDASLPSFLISQRSPGVGADFISWYYGFRGYGVFGRPVVGFAASSMASGGIFCVILMPWLILMPLFWLIDNVSGRLRNDVISVAVTIVSSLVVEMAIDSAISFAMRDLILLLSFILMVNWAFRYIVESTRRAARISSF